MRVRVTPRDVYRLLNHGPTTLVTSCLPDGSSVNVMAAAWVMPLDFEPPKVAVVVAQDTLTRERFEATRELSLSVPTVAIVDATYRVGSVSGREVEKLSELGLATAPATRVRPPLVETGCVAWLELEAYDEPAVLEKYDLVVAEVVAAWAEDAVFRDREWRFKKDDPRRTIHHMAKGVFFATGERIEARRPR
jgi:flavin reductase (DIM6/NTAB) family NADH-FMN oxidoreductase RutF